MTNKGKVLTLIAAIVAVMAVGGTVAIPLTNAPEFCASCHTLKPSYDTWLKSSHRDVTCVDCHVRPGVKGLIQDKIFAGIKDVAITFLGTPSEPHDLVAHVQTSVCISCHRAVLRVSEVSVRDLPKPVNNVGLIMSHRKHMVAFDKRNKGEGCTTCPMRESFMGYLLRDIQLLFHVAM